MKVKIWIRGRGQKVKDVSPTRKTHKD